MGFNYLVMIRLWSVTDLEIGTLTQLQLIIILLLAFSCIICIQVYLCYWTIYIRKRHNVNIMPYASKSIFLNNITTSLMLIQFPPYETQTIYIYLLARLPFTLSQQKKNSFVYSAYSHSNPFYSLWNSILSLEVSFFVRDLNY